MLPALPKVSFLVPAYNHDAFVVDALDSVVNDRYPHKELLILNDGSTDQTDARIQEWLKTHELPFHVQYVHRENRGVTRTLNELISLASGRYFRVLASDDALLPDGTLALYEALRGRPEKKAAAGDCEVIDQSGRITAPSILKLHGTRVERLTSDQGLQHEVINHWGFAGPAILIDTNYFSSIGAYNEQTKIEDWDAFLRLVADNRLVAVTHPVARYRLHGANASRARVREQRARNQTYQRQAALDNLQRFTGRAKFLLRSQGSLMTAKIAFLERKFWLLPFHLGLYLFFQFIAVWCRQGRT